jgi:hypothetical protein
LILCRYISDHLDPHGQQIRMTHKEGEVIAGRELKDALRAPGLCLKPAARELLAFDRGDLSAAAQPMATPWSPARRSSSRQHPSSGMMRPRDRALASSLSNQSWRWPIALAPIAILSVPACLDQCSLCGTLAREASDGRAWFSGNASMFSASPQSLSRLAGIYSSSASLARRKRAT